jgi:hypothetical protein
MTEHTKKHTRDEIPSVLEELAHQVRQAGGVDEESLRRLRKVAHGLRLVVYDIGTMLDEARRPAGQGEPAGEPAADPRGLIGAGLGSPIRGDPDAPPVGPTGLPTGFIVGLGETEGDGGEIVAARLTRWEIGYLCRHWHDKHQGILDLGAMGQSGSCEWRMSLYAPYRINALWDQCPEERRHEIERDSARRSLWRAEIQGRSYEELMMERSPEPGLGPDRDAMARREIDDLLTRIYGRKPWMVVPNLAYLVQRIIGPLREEPDGDEMEQQARDEGIRQMFEELTDDEDDGDEVDKAAYRASDERPPLVIIRLDARDPERNGVAVDALDTFRAKLIEGSVRAALDGGERLAESCPGSVPAIIYVQQSSEGEDISVSLITEDPDLDLRTQPPCQLDWLARMHEPDLRTSYHRAVRDEGWVRPVALLLIDNAGAIANAYGITMDAARDLLARCSEHMNSYFIIERSDVATMLPWLAGTAVYIDLLAQAEAHPETFIAITVVGNLREPEGTLLHLVPIDGAMTAETELTTPIKDLPFTDRN